jgi:hypothetical protein
MASKYRAQPEIVDGIRFASKKEARRYGELKLLLRAGEIHGLELQPRFPLIVNGKKVCVYVADFAYLDNDGNRVVEDVKSKATVTPLYRVKLKLLMALQPELDHREVY